MRRMISEEKANLLNKQTIDNNGVIVDENDREFNGDINFTGTVTGVTGGTQLYIHKFSVEDVDFQEITGVYLYVVNNVATPTDFQYLDFIKSCNAILEDSINGTVKQVYYNGGFSDGTTAFNTGSLISTETL